MAKTCPTCKKTRSGKPCRTCKIPAVVVSPAPLPPPPPPEPVPVPTTNEPAGMIPRTTLRFDQPLPPAAGGDQQLGVPGWGINYNAEINDPNGWAVSVVEDGKSACDFVYPAGMVEGTAPATIYWGAAGTDELYVRFWWKPSAGFNPGPNGTKLLHIRNDPGGKQFLILMPDGKLHVYPEYSSADTQWRSPMAAVPVVPLGQGHLVEWWANRLTGAGAVWLDGVLHLRYDGAVSTHPFDYIQFSPTFGGNSGATKQRTDHFYLGDVFLSTR
jgi:hypothetical protein